MGLYELLPNPSLNPHLCDSNTFSSTNGSQKGCRWHEDISLGPICVAAPHNSKHWALGRDTGAGRQARGSRKECFHHSFGGLSRFRCTPWSPWRRKNLSSPPWLGAVGGHWEVLLTGLGCDMWPPFPRCFNLLWLWPCGASSSEGGPVGRAVARGQGAVSLEWQAVQGAEAQNPTQGALWLQVSTAVGLKVSKVWFSKFPPSMNKWGWLPVPRLP